MKPARKLGEAIEEDATTRATSIEETSKVAKSSGMRARAYRCSPSAGVVWAGYQHTAGGGGRRRFPPGGRDELWSVDRELLPASPEAPPREELPGVRVQRGRLQLPPRRRHDAHLRHGSLVVVAGGGGRRAPYS